MITIAMYVGERKPAEIVRYFNDLIEDLGDNGVEVMMEYTSESRLIIQTPKTYITFIRDIKQMEGRLFNQVFGELPDKFILGRLKEPRERWILSLLDYVVSVEFGGFDL